MPPKNTKRIVRRRHFKYSRQKKAALGGRRGKAFFQRLVEEVAGNIFWQK
jgi:hypothetical protein